jgi:hypothetical protein
MPCKNCSTDAHADQPETGRMVSYRVFVGGLPYDIAVYSTLKSESVAVAEYRGKHIEVRGADALSAADAWAKAATRLSARMKIT